MICTNWMPEPHLRFKSCMGCSAAVRSHSLTGLIHENLHLPSNIVNLGIGLMRGGAVAGTVAAASAAVAAAVATAIAAVSAAAALAIDRSIAVAAACAVVAAIAAAFVAPWP